MPLALYPAIVLANDLSPDQGFGSSVDDICQELEDATKGWGANKQKCVDALAKQDATTRTKIYIRYKELKNTDLDALMKKEFSGDFGHVMQFLALPPNKMECLMLKRATEGVGASANIIWSICCGRTNEEMQVLKKTYFEMYSRDLGKLLSKELTGNMERLIFNCLQADEQVFDPQFHTKEKAIEDAETIYKKGQGRMGTEERGIFKVICAAPPNFLEMISQAYADKYGYTLPKAMEKELGSVTEKHIREATLYCIGMKLKPFETAAETIKLACSGIGTDELLLTCCILRYEQVLQQVMTAHIELFGKTIQDRVRSECGGMYKTALLTFLDRIWPES